MSVICFHLKLSLLAWFEKLINHFLTSEITNQLELSIQHLTRLSQLLNLAIHWDSVRLGITGMGGSTITELVMGEAGNLQCQSQIVLQILVQGHCYTSLELCLTQTAVSVQISEIKQRCGLSLFVLCWNGRHSLANPPWCPVCCLQGHLPQRCLWDPHLQGVFSHVRM